MSDNVTAKEVLDFAKNRLNKFYNRASANRREAHQGEVGRHGHYGSPRRHRGHWQPCARARRYPARDFRAVQREDRDGQRGPKVIDLLIKVLDKEKQEAGVLRRLRKRSMSSGCRMQQGSALPIKVYH